MSQAKPFMLMAGWLWSKSQQSYGLLVLWALQQSAICRNPPQNPLSSGIKARAAITE
jgi:hypothetical protein